MRRSLLFMPGNNPAMLQNSDVFESDAVIYDLEDAVSITEKDAARCLVAQYLKSMTKQPPMEIVVFPTALPVPASTTLIIYNEIPFYLNSVKIIYEDITFMSIDNIL